MPEITSRPLTVRPGRPMVRTTFQFCASIEPAAGKSAEDTLREAAGVTLDWLASKFPAALPLAAKAGKSFNADEHGQTLQVVSIPEIGLWSARLMQPDAPSPYGDRDAVAGRTWTTELSLAADGAKVRVGIRVLCASLPFTQAPIKLTRPRVVVDLANRFDMRDVKPVASEPLRLEREDELPRLFALLTNPDRSLPVFMLTQPDPHRLGINVKPFLLDEVQLARRLQGLGHVVTMPKDLNPLWTMMVGKTWSAFMGAVRTYRPRLDFDQDSPTNHPLALADRVLAFERDGEIAEDAFTSFLVDQAFVYAATKPIEWKPCVFHADALQREAEIARTRAKDDQDWKQLYEQEITALSKRAEEAEGLANSYADDVDSFKSQLAEAEEENRRLGHYVETLRAQLEAKTGRSADAAITIPEDYDSLPEWVEANLAGRLLLHPRATRGLKDAKYEDVPLVYKALLALGMEYRNMRLRSADDEAPKVAWERKIGELGLECEGSITKERAGEQGDTYFVKYPLGTVKNQFLDLHLRKGRTKDDRLCLAIYFFWDDEKRRVVVGWLPSHLDNRMT